ncbi:MAG: MOSC N-terminal beta barrel domain-containing protein [Anaerolineae bacterium]|nr:MOSC N-terminal beta barrel domain-containing protein [Anaerolineae bacterium]
MSDTIMLTHIHTYPIKSCGALSHTRIELDKRGPVWDRRWMVVDSAGVFITQRELPALALIQPAFEDGYMKLRAPGMADTRVPLHRDTAPCRVVRVWKDTCEAWDEGDDLAGWFSDYLHTEARLVRMTDNYVRRVDPRYARQPAQTGFADAFPLLIVSEASLAELNRHLVDRGSAPVPMSRFRPNLVVSGCAPFAEDTWQTIRIGTVILDIVKPCARCVTTTVDQATGTIPDVSEPLAALKTFRKQDGKVMFAQNTIHRAPGVVAVGDVLAVESKA